MQPYASPQDIAAGANVQPWDPSIKALTAFPQVLAEMNQNLSWTTELGNAYYNQPSDVFDSIQAMRQRAQAAGTLQSTPQETVSDDQGYIALAPSNPQVVYVPAYNPWAVYGAPVAPWPGFSVLGALGSLAGGFGLRFGPGIVTAAFLGMPWGWFGWGLSWLGHCLFFDHQGYYPQQAITTTTAASQTIVALPITTASATTAALPTTAALLRTAATTAASKPSTAHPPSTHAPATETKPAMAPT